MLGDGDLLDRAKRRLAVLVEVRTDRPDQPLEVGVDVDVPAPGLLGRPPRERRLPRPHEPDERNVPPQRP